MNSAHIYKSTLVDGSTTLINLRSICKIEIRPVGSIGPKGPEYSNHRENVGRIIVSLFTTGATEPMHSINASEIVARDIERRWGAANSEPKARKSKDRIIKSII